MHEELELLNEDGSVFQTIIVELKVDEIIKEFRAKQLELIHAQQALKNSTSDKEKIEKLGNAVISFFELIFGEKQSELIINYYEKNYTEMVTDIFPFINEKITPAITLAVNEYKSKLSKNYNRKQKRALMFK